jgi:hypothetical protein
VCNEHWWDIAACTVCANKKKNSFLNFGYDFKKSHSLASFIHDTKKYSENKERLQYMTCVEALNEHDTRTHFV